MEHDPFAVVEAMAIEAFAVGADKAYLYIRGEYPLAEPGSRTRSRGERRRPAWRPRHRAAARRRRLHLRRGDGPVQSIEGKRGEPRNKPPFPVEVGLFGKPTAVNNVETLVNVLLIVGEDGGAEAFKAIGTEGSTGPKLFCVSGHVERPGRTRSTSGRRSGAARAGGRRARRPGAEGRPARRGRRRLRRARRARHAADVRGDAGDRGDARLRVSSWRSTRPPTSSARSGGSPSSSATSRAASASPAGSGQSARRSCSRASRRPARSRATSSSCWRDRPGDARRSICGLGQTATSAIESAFRQPELVAL